MNNDGIDDLIIGERDGWVNFFERKPDGTLKSGIRLVDSNGEIDVGENSSPELVDWDNDGDLDLLVGQSQPGNVAFFRNEGTKETPDFVYVGPLEAGSVVIKHDRCQVQVADLNSDGLPDLLCGNGNSPASPTKIFYYKNVGILGSPVLEKVGPVTYNDGSEVGAKDEMHFCAGDFNEDGSVDIIFGVEGYTTSPLRLILGDAQVNKSTHQFNSVLYDVDFKIVNRSITIHMRDGIVNDISILSIQGRLLDKIIAQGDNVTKISLKIIGTGNYIVKVNTSKGDFNRLIKVK